MAYESVKNQIDAYIKANGVNLITGPVLNAVLTTMLDELGEGYAFQGVLNTTDTPSPAADIPQAWLASAGTYLGGSITVDEGELALIIHTADGWSKETIYRGVQLSFDAIVSALGYTPADEDDLAEKQDTISDLAAIRSGAALGETSVQPADIEDMVKAEPIGSIVPPVNPSEFATNVKLTKNGQPVFPVTDESLVMGLNYRPYDSENPNGMGYLVLKKNKTFAEQVTEENTIYEIRYEFSLSSDVAIPSNCELYFNGGRVLGASIICDNTLISGDVKLEGIKGTVRNTSVNASWFSTSNYSDIAQTIFNSGSTLFVDKNIAMDGTAKTVSSIRIDGDGTISNPNRYTVTGGIVLIKNVSIEGSTGGVFITPSGPDSLNLVLGHVHFDGEGNCERFFNWFDTSKTTELHLDVDGCIINGILSCFINCGGNVTGRISNCEFSDYGSFDTSNTMQSVLRLGREYNGTGLANNVSIVNNRFTGIKAPYLTGDDSKETHAILLYGYNCRIVGNYVGEIVSDNGDRDPGAETEGIYVKGSYHVISGNTLVNAAGNISCDGAIALKGLTDVENGRHYNTISENTIVLSNGYGIGITSYGVRTSIVNNTINSGKSIGTPISFTASVDSLIANNRIITSPGTVPGEKPSCTAFTMNRQCDKLIFEKNILTIATLAVIYPAAGETPEYLFLDNEVLCKDVQFSGNVKYGTFLNATGTSKLTLRGNRFAVDSCRATALFETSAELFFERNYFRLFTTNGSTIAPYFAGIFRNVTKLIMVDNIFDVSGYSSMSLVYQVSEGVVSISENTKYDGTTTITNGQSVISKNATILGQKNYGTTEERQAVVLRGEAGMVGYQFFDTTLSKVCYAKTINNNTGAVTWVDATGTTV